MSRLQPGAKRPDAGLPRSGLMAHSILAPGRCVTRQSIPENGVTNPARSRQPFDWSDVRPVYRAMHSEFPRLTRPFSLTIPAETSRDLAVLIAAMDLADRELDGRRDAVERQQLAGQVLQVLAGGDRSQAEVSLPSGLRRRIDDLRQILQRRGIEAEVVQTVAAIFRLSESKRLAASARDHLRLAEEEWRTAGRLPLLILGQHSTPRFESFFLRFCGAMHAVDSALDGRKDFRSGLMAFRPGLRFHARVLWRLVRELPRWIFGAPGATCLVSYAVPLFRAAASPEVDAVEAAQVVSQSLS